MQVFTYSFTPRFADTDAAGIIHFSKLFCYAEEAEHTFLISLGFPIQPGNDKCLQWPRVACTAEYLRPISAFKPLNVILTVKRLGATSVTWHWDIQNGTHSYARGELKTVCCTIVENRLEPTPIPDNLRQILNG